MMNVQNIQELLEKFWNAETTSADEAVLNNYFSGESIDASLSYAQSYFKKSQTNTDITSSIIGKLVEKYFNAETTADEEGLIKEYFNQENISAELMQYKMLFKVLNKAATIKYGKELVIDISKTDITKNESDKTVKVIKFNWWKTAAAASVIALGGYFVGNNLFTKTMPSPQIIAMNKSNIIEPKTAEEAYEITLQALALVSNKYNKGQDQIFAGMKNFHDAADLTN